MTDSITFEVKQGPHQTRSFSYNVTDSPIGNPSVFGRVYKANEEYDTKSWIIKQSNSPQYHPQFETEYNLLFELSMTTQYTPNPVYLVERQVQGGNVILGLAMPFYQTTLRSELASKEASPAQFEHFVLRYFHQYAKLLDNLHNAGKVCTDRKEEDLFLNNEQLVVIDWNALRDISDLNAERNVTGRIWYNIITGFQPRPIMDVFDDSLWQRVGTTHEQGVISIGLRLILNYLLTISVTGNQDQLQSLIESWHCALFGKELPGQQYSNDIDYLADFRRTLEDTIPLTDGEFEALKSDIGWRRNTTNNDRLIHRYDKFSDIRNYFISDSVIANLLRNLPDDLADSRYDYDRFIEMLRKQPTQTALDQHAINRWIWLLEDLKQHDDLRGEKRDQHIDMIKMLTAHVNENTIAGLDEASIMISNLSSLKQLNEEIAYRKDILEADQKLEAYRAIRDKYQNSPNWEVLRQLYDVTAGLNVPTLDYQNIDTLVDDAEQNLNAYILNPEGNIYSAVFGTFHQSLYPSDKTEHQPLDRAQHLDYENKTKVIREFVNAISQLQADNLSAESILKLYHHTKDKYEATHENWWNFVDGLFQEKYLTANFPTFQIHIENQHYELASAWLRQMRDGNMDWNDDIKNSLSKYETLIAETEKSVESIPDNIEHQVNQHVLEAKNTLTAFTQKLEALTKQTETSIQNSINELSDDKIEKRIQEQIQEQVEEQVSATEKSLKQLRGLLIGTVIFLILIVGGLGVYTVSQSSSTDANENLIQEIDSLKQEIQELRENPPSVGAQSVDPITASETPIQQPTETPDVQPSATPEPIETNVVPTTDDTNTNVTIPEGESTEDADSDSTIPSIAFDVIESQDERLPADGTATGIIYITINNLPDGVTPTAIVEEAREIVVTSTRLLEGDRWAITYQAGTTAETANIQVQFPLADGTLITSESFNVETVTENITIDAEILKDGEAPSQVTSGETYDIVTTIATADGAPILGQYDMTIHNVKVDGTSELLYTWKIGKDESSVKSSYLAPDFLGSTNVTLRIEVLAGAIKIAEKQLALTIEPPIVPLEGINQVGADGGELSAEEITQQRLGIIRKPSSRSSLPSNPIPQTELTFSVATSPTVPNQRLRVSFQRLDQIGNIASPQLIINPNGDVTLDESNPIVVQANENGILTFNLRSLSGAGLIQLTITDANTPDGASTSWVFPVAETVATVPFIPSPPNSVEAWKNNYAIELSPDVHFGYAYNLLGGTSREEKSEHFYYVLSSIPVNEDGAPKLAVISEFAIPAVATNGSAPFSITYTQEQDVLINSNLIPNQAKENVQGNDTTIPFVLSATTRPRREFHSLQPFAVFRLTNGQTTTPNTYIYPEQIEITDSAISGGVPAFEGYVAGLMSADYLDIDVSGE